jgi:hypothetical protein
MVWGSLRSVGHSIRLRAENVWVDEVGPRVRAPCLR